MLLNILALNSIKNPRIKDSTDEFLCKNEGYFPKTIKFWMVSDGICDCCDGSDEDPVKCPNVCARERADFEARLAIIRETISVYPTSMKEEVGFWKWVVQDYKQRQSLNIVNSSFPIPRAIPEELATLFTSNVIADIEDRINRISFKPLDNEPPRGIIWSGNVDMQWKQSINRGHDSLGRFKSFNGTHAHFDYGSRCWYNNRNRATDIELLCWNETILSEVVEISPCYYIGYLATPFACKPEFSRSLENFKPQDVEKYDFVLKKRLKG